MVEVVVEPDETLCVAAVRQSQLGRRRTQAIDLDLRDVIVARTEPVSGGREGALGGALALFEGAAVPASVGSAQSQIFVGKVHAQEDPLPLSSFARLEMRERSKTCNRVAIGLPLCMGLIK